MTLKEASKKFCVPLKVLKNYEAWGLLAGKQIKQGVAAYQAEQFDSLGLIELLFKAGFTKEEIKKYLDLQKDASTKQEQINLLKKGRRSLHNEIRHKQNTLDKIDFILWNKQKND